MEEQIFFLFGRRANSGWFKINQGSISYLTEVANKLSSEVIDVEISDDPNFAFIRNAKQGIRDTGEGIVKGAKLAIGMGGLPVKEYIEERGFAENIREGLQFKKEGVEGFKRGLQDIQKRYEQQDFRPPKTPTGDWRELEMQKPNLSNVQAQRDYENWVSNQSRKLPPNVQRYSPVYKSTSFVGAPSKTIISKYEPFFPSFIKPNIRQYQPVRSRARIPRNKYVPLTQQEWDYMRKNLSKEEYQYLWDLEQSILNMIA